MKIRTGFVSNSSSSSFIVTFPYTPHSVEECQKMLFPKLYDLSFLGHHSPDRIASIVFADIQDQLYSGSNTSENVKNLAQELLDDGYYTRQKYNISDEEALAKSPLDIARNILKNKEDNSTFEFTYADDEGELNSFMEHGGIFRYLPHAYESNH